MTWKYLLLGFCFVGAVPLAGQATPQASPLGAESAVGRPLAPDAVLEVPGGPLLVHFESPGTAVASLRVSLPLSESPSEAGAGQALVLAALNRARPLARRVGAQIEGVRSFHGIAYTVTGPAAAFDHLAWLLREMLREPLQAGVDRAVAELRTGLEQGEETPAGVLEASLRDGVVPGLPPLSGSPASLASMNHSLVRGLWARTHTLEAMTVVAAAPVPVEVLLAGILDAGVPPGAAGPSPPSVGTAPRNRTRRQVIRSWYGEAYRIDTPDDPRSAVSARLLARHLRSLPGRVEAGVELWEVGASAALVVTGTAYPEDASAMRRTIQGVRAEVVASYDPVEVRQIVQELRGETLLSARSNRGLVSVVGYHLDATGEPASAQTFFDTLSSLDEPGIRAFLEQLLASTPVVADVRP